MSGRIPWALVIAAAVQIVVGYDTGVTLRQLHYRLVSRPELGYPNTIYTYKELSKRTAKLRRSGEFPDLSDRTRSIQRHACWESPNDALAALTAQYRRDRTEGQDVSVFIGVEKAGLVNQLDAWFGDLGVPILALSGYASQSFVRDVATDVARHDRPAVLLYAGDFDPSGEDIDRDFVARTDCWANVERVALTSDQVDDFALPPALGKSTDSRAGAFVERHGRLVQVELDAVPPDTLRTLYEDALGEWWDVNAYAACAGRERTERAALASLEVAS